jgi:NAD/NADP transhydrogenase beta subunit
MQLKKAFLIGAFVAVTIIALLYGVSPTWFAATFLGVTDLNLNFAHILRAIAGLYLALAAFWLYAAFNDKYRDAALLTTMLFAGGLAAGRCVSLILDGQPAPVLLLYGVMELAVVLVAYWVFRLPER